MRYGHGARKLGTGGDPIGAAGQPQVPTSLILAFSRCWQDGIKYVLQIIPNGELHAWKQQSTKAPPEVPLCRWARGRRYREVPAQSLLSPSPEALGN